MAKEQKSYARRNYFIDRSFQSKFILKFCLLVALGGFFSIGIIYLLAMRSTSVSIIDSRVVVKTTADFMLPILIQTVVIVTIILSLAVALMTLLLSHKIAGPLYRFRKAFKLLLEGDFSNDFKIREFDQLQDLAVEFNNMIIRTRDKIGSLKNHFNDLKNKIHNISESEIAEHKRSYLAEMKRISAEFDKIIGQFKA